MRQRVDFAAPSASSAVARPADAGAAGWLDAGLSGVAENLALDEALLAEAHDGRLASMVVRTWMATEPTIVLGSSSRATAEVDGPACASLGIRTVRRPSGGLTVLVGPGCLMWSVVAPLAGPTAVDVLHAALLTPLAAALTAAAGRPVVRRGSSDLVIVVDGVERKISGNALRLRRHAVLYHGTLLDAFDLGLVGRTLRHPPREPDYRGGRSHGDFLANIGLGRPRLEAAVRAAFGADATQHDWPRDRWAELLRDRYQNATWTDRLP